MLINNDVNDDKEECSHFSFFKEYCTHSFMKQTFSKCLLCARYCSSARKVLELVEFKF